MQYLFCLFTTDIHPAMQTATIKSQSRFVIQIFATQSYRHTIQALGSGRCKWRPLHAAGKVHMPYPRQRDPTSCHLATVFTNMLGE